jgi:glutaredoxin-like protein
MREDAVAFLNERTREEVRGMLAGLSGEVSLLLFTGGEECLYCDETRQLLEEVAGLSDRLRLEVRDAERERETAEHYGIDKTALVVQGEKDHGIRFYGIPSGYEFATLLETIRLVSRNDPELSPELLARVGQITRPVHLQVFVTPTCPYCPQAVVAAHKLALASEHIRADMVEATEFPELAQRYRVMGVPRTVLADGEAIEGAVPTEHLVEWLLAEVGVGA